MKVNYLREFVYAGDGSTHSSRDVSAPIWEEIEATIRGLDMYCHPWCWLFTGDQHDDPTDNCLTIMGGKGIYWVALSAGKHDQLRLFDPNLSSREVDVWTSDQGFSDHEFHMTYNIELILRLARHFAETGEPLPEDIWEV